MSVEFDMLAPAVLTSPILFPGEHSRLLSLAEVAVTGYGEQYDLTSTALPALYVSTLFVYFLNTVPEGLAPAKALKLLLVLVFSVYHNNVY